MRDLVRRSVPVAIAALLVAAGSSPPAPGQVRRATVAIEGMSCPFCAYGVEKKLRALPGVDRVDVSMKDGRAVLTAADKESIGLEAVPGAVRAAGFTPGTMRAVVAGRLVADGGRFFVGFDGHDHALAVEPTARVPQDRLERLAAAGADVVLEGEVRPPRRKGEPLRLLPEKVSS